MTVKAEDRRVQRTRALLLNALLDLIVERGYEEITVQDIVDRANVGRSTFYKHFLDKRELLLNGVDGLRSSLVQQRSTRDSSVTERDGLLTFSLLLFQHVQANLRFCRALLSPHSAAVVEPQIQRILAELVREELAVCISPDTKLAVPLDVLIQYTVSAFLGLLRWWMDQPAPCSAEEIDRQFRALTIPALGAALESPALAGIG
jgi:AcrR family transcriptional regulator